MWKPALYLEPLPRRPRGHYRYAPRITLPSTRPQPTVVTPQKKRKLSSDTFVAPETQAEVHTAPSSRANGSFTFAQPRASNKGAVKVSTTQPSPVSKLSLIGGVEVLGDLRHTLLHLRSHSSHSSLVPNQDMGVPSTSGPLDKLLSLRSTHVFSILRIELEAIEVGEQLHRFRKRIAPSNFFEFYEGAQANALSSFMEIVR